MQHEKTNFNYTIFNPDKLITFGDIMTLRDVIRWRISDIAWYIGKQTIYGTAKHEQTEVKDPVVSMLSRFYIMNSSILDQPVVVAPKHHPVDLLPICEKHRIPVDRHKIATLFGKTFNTVCQWYRDIAPVSLESRPDNDRTGRDIQRLVEVMITTIEADGPRAFAFWMDMATNEGRLNGNAKAAAGKGWEKDEKDKKRKTNKYKSLK